MFRYYKTQDPKYDICIDDNGQAFLVNSVTKDAIPDDEPIMIFRAKDKFATVAINAYSEVCNNSDHLEAIFNRLNQFMEFKESNDTKEPDTDLSIFGKGESIAKES